MVGMVVFPVAGGEEDTVLDPDLLVPLLMAHHGVGQPCHRQLILLNRWVGLNKFVISHTE